jgi:hypothetical protein
VQASASPEAAACATCDAASVRERTYRRRGLAIDATTR